MLKALPDTWLAAPLIAGAWADLSQTDAAAALEILAAALERGAAQNFLRHAETPRVRAMPVSFYPDWLLLECQSILATGTATLVNFLLGSDGVVLLDGRAEGIHKLNMHCKARFGEATTARDYLVFFCSAVRAGGGRFEVLDTPDQLAFVPGADTAAVDAARAAVKPISAGEAVKDGIWFDTTVRYAGGLYSSSFVVTPKGLVEMKEEDVLLPSPPLEPELFEGPFRLAPEHRS